MLPALFLFAITFAVNPASMPSSCGTNEYYDYIQYKCTTCPTNTTIDTTINCKCASLYYRNRLAIGFLSSDYCLTNPGVLI
jgi:hypothetical protein